MKIRIIYVFTLLLLIILLGACGSGEERLSQEEINATAAHVAATMIFETRAAMPTPTNTLIPPSPTITVPPSASPTPEGLLFRDDFDGALRPEWAWENETPDRWTLTEDGWLQIIGEDLSLFNDGAQNNLLLMDVPSGDFEMVSRVNVEATNNVHQAAIVLLGDGNNYVLVTRAFCKIPTCQTDGHGVFMEYKIAGGWQFFSTPVEASDLYLRLVFQGDTISGYYALEPGQWTLLGEIQSFFAFTRIGLGVSNVDVTGVENDVVGRFDFFEVRTPQP